jgi:S-adenosylmethionine-diacylgycerolhomoserine-N-methlytransferase
MDGVYRYQRYIYDLTRKYYLFGRDRLIDELAPKPGARVVEIGCGTARNLIRMARRYPDAQLFGLDASGAMLETAAKAVARAGLSDRIRLAHGYAEALSPAMFGLSDGFDEAVFSYSLSMIPDWNAALAAADAALAPGGRIHIVDFGDLTGFAGPLRKGLLAWLRLFHVAPRTELLGSLEKSPGDFQVLTGRYAFLFHGTRKRI